RVTDRQVVGDVLLHGDGDAGPRRTTVPAQVVGDHADTAVQQEPHRPPVATGVLTEAVHQQEQGSRLVRVVQRGLHAGGAGDDDRGLAHAAETIVRRRPTGRFS